MAVLPLLLGVVCAAGIALIADGARRRQPGPPPPPRRPAWTTRDRTRLAAAVAAALGVAVLTRWPVGALLAGIAVYTLPRVLGPDREHKHILARIEAVATWTELLRDNLSSAAGLEQAIVATAKVAPAPIRTPVQNLAGAARAGVRLPDALRAFAADLADPTADLVVRALIQASSQHGGKLGESLSQLAATARDQAAARLRINTGRASLRTDAKVITGATAALIGGLVVFNHSFLAPYDSAPGQLMLLLVGAGFAGGFWWLARISHVAEPPRILSKPDGFAAGAATPVPAVRR